MRGLLIGAAAAIAAVPTVSAQDQAHAEAARLCRSKASLLTRYLDKIAVEAIERDGEAAARAAIAAARARLESAGVGDVYESGCAEYDDALRVIAAASANAPKSLDENEVKAAYQRRREQFSAYLKALSSSPRSEWPEDLRRRFAQADLKFTEAGKYAAERNYNLASATIETAYQDLLAVVKSLNDGKLVVHQLVFNSPADEFRYEQDRNRSYEMLLQIAINEAPPSAELATHVQRVISENSRRRVAAEQMSRSGDDRAAINEIEIASGELAKALRLVGVMVWD